jgi:hypothetical protein
MSTNIKLVVLTQEIIYPSSFPRSAIKHGGEVYAGWRKLIARQVQDRIGLQLTQDLMQLVESLLLSLTIDISDRRNE